MLHELERQKENYKAVRARLMPEPPRVKRIPITQELPISSPVPVRRPQPLVQGTGITREAGYVRDEKTGKPMDPIRAYANLHKYPSCEDVAEECCEFYRRAGIKDLRSSIRTSEVVFVRHVVFYLAKELTLYSYPHIGRWMGGKDHTTVIHGYRKITRALLTDRELMDELNYLSNLIVARHRLRNAATEQKFLGLCEQVQEIIAADLAR
jgi:hypothetical protein